MINPISSFNSHDSDNLISLRLSKLTLFLTLSDDPKSDLSNFQKRSIYFNHHLFKNPAINGLKFWWLELT